MNGRYQRRDAGKASDRAPPARPRPNVQEKRVKSRGKTLAAAVMFLAAGACIAGEPLTIKGLAPGDPIEKMSQIGVCQLARGGFCIGSTSYGPAPDARFSVTYVGGRISSIVVSFDARYSPEVLRGLTEKFGASLPAGCKVGVDDCHTWRSDGLSLLLIEHIGAVTLNRSAPAGGY